MSTTTTEKNSHTARGAGATKGPLGRGAGDMASPYRTGPTIDIARADSGKSGRLQAASDTVPGVSSGSMAVHTPAKSPLSRRRP